jgi:multicomponent Na+:H+ antiporter subunit F
VPKPSPPSTEAERRPVVNVVTSICLGVLVVSALLCLLRVVRPGSLADRIVGLDSLLVVVVGGIAVLTARQRSGTFVTMLIVVALIGFVGTVTVARFIERRGA